MHRDTLGQSPTDRRLINLSIDGVPVRLQEFLHVKPGKGSAFVRTKIKNLVNGSVQERTFRAGESIVAAEVSKTEMQYTYSDGDSICFMNMETFEEQRVDKKKIDDENFLIQGEVMLHAFYAYMISSLCIAFNCLSRIVHVGLSCQISIWNDQVIDVSLPQTVTYTVVETPPNFKGNTAQGANKPATLDSGAVVMVPMFIEIGEKIVVSTTEKKYMNRA